MASELNLDAAEALINSAADSAKRLATAALRKFISQVSEQGGSIVGANVLAASGRSLTDLRAILRSHPAIHTAEGELFRTALLHACHQCGILASPIREKSLMDAAISELGLTEQQITKRLVEMGQELGRPWTQDEKLATLAAWLTLFRGSPLT
jgi:hypothetical protein